MQINYRGKITIIPVPIPKKATTSFLFSSRQEGATRTPEHRGSWWCMKELLARRATENGGLLRPRWRWLLLHLHLDLLLYQWLLHLRRKRACYRGGRYCSPHVCSAARKNWNIVEGASDNRARGLCSYRCRHIGKEPSTRRVICSPGRRHLVNREQRASGLRCGDCCSGGGGGTHCTEGAAGTRRNSLHNRCGSHGSKN
jgi:hypothetical protein